MDSGFLDPCMMPKASSVQGDDPSLPLAEPVAEPYKHLERIQQKVFERDSTAVAAVLLLEAAGNHKAKVTELPAPEADLYHMLGGRVGDALVAGEKLKQGEKLVSENAKYSLVMQGNGNLVGYEGDRAFWSSKTNGMGEKPYQALMQSDGNFVVSGNGTPAWATDTLGKGGSLLKLQNDRNIVMYDNNNESVWSSGTLKAAMDFTITRGHNGEHGFMNQRQPARVVHSPDGRAGRRRSRSTDGPAMRHEEDAEAFDADARTLGWIDPDGPAYQAGMRPAHVGWIITHVDGQQVTAETVVAALSATQEPDRTFTIRVQRPEKEFFKVFINKKTGQKLGLGFSLEDGVTLKITEVMSDGLVQQWNEKRPEQAAKVGDSIVEVRVGDSIVRGDAQEILDECRQDKMLELLVKFGQVARVHDDASGLRGLMRCVQHTIPNELVLEHASIVPWQQTELLSRMSALADRHVDYVPAEPLGCGAGKFERGRYFIHSRSQMRFAMAIVPEAVAEGCSVQFYWGSAASLRPLPVADACVAAVLSQGDAHGLPAHPEADGASKGGAKELSELQAQVEKVHSQICAEIVYHEVRHGRWPKDEEIQHALGACKQACIKLLLRELATVARSAGVVDVAAVWDHLSASTITSLERQGFRCFPRASCLESLSWLCFRRAEGTSEGTGAGSIGPPDVPLDQNVCFLKVEVPQSGRSDPRDSAVEFGSCFQAACETDGADEVRIVVHYLLPESHDRDKRAQAPRSGPHLEFDTEWERMSPDVADRLGPVRRFAEELAASVSEAEERMRELLARELDAIEPEEVAHSWFWVGGADSFFLRS
jgi:hypothetical protein